MKCIARMARVAAVLTLAAGSFAIAVETADARAGRGGSSGSRGSQTYSTPPSTSTAPGQAAPVNRSITQPGQPSATAAAARPGAAATQTASRFGGLKGLLLGGLIGAGLASLFGAGALASVLGFLLQMMLIAGVVMLVVAFFRSRSANRPAMASAAAGGGTSAGYGDQNYRTAASSLGGAAVTLAQSDYDAFERLLGEIQTLYGSNDVDALGTRVTPEMLSYFAHELDENAKNGVINEISDVKLLQGDLSEVWREGTVDYATVAMRYSLIDATIETRSGRVVSGSKTTPQEVTEVWTFVRPANGRSDQWELSAIQQTG